MGFVDEEDPLFPWGGGVDLETLWHYHSFDQQQQQQQQQLPQEISVSLQGVPTQILETGNSSLEKTLVLREQEHTASHLRDLTDSLIYALQRINVSCGVLVQVWMPYREANMVFLTTKNQPYVMAKKYKKLVRYRNVSASYVFPARYGSQAFPGLPGRVFLTQAAEWTPNVQFYSCHEFLRVKEAMNCDVKGTLALPVMEANSRACVAVLEVALSIEKLEYGPEIDDISNALQAASLRTTSTIGIIPEIYENRQSVWLEIEEILTTVCKTHTLPLAQVWIPVANNGVVKLITKNTPFCGKSGFRKPCEEHALLEGQGLPGRALNSIQAVFCVDIKAYNKDDYPLGHYARLFNLSAALAIRLRSILTGKDDYILEFFLPPDCKSTQQQLLDSFANILHRVSRSLRTILDKETQEISICNMQETTLSTISSAQLSEVVEESSPTSSIICNNRSRKKAKRGAVEKFVSLNVLQQHFTGKLKDAAKLIGVCPTTLKKICRKHGIERWPSRKLKKIDRQYKKIQNMLTSVKGLSPDSTVVSVGGVSLLGSAKTGYQAQSQTRLSISEEHQLEHETTSHKSSSSLSSNGQSSEVVLERNSSLISNAFFTIKVTNGNDVVRFKLPVDNSGMDNFREEIARRMNLEGREFGLKYLDEDKEWIRLESNEELTECMAVMRSNKNKIKLFLVL